MLEKDGDSRTILGTLITSTEANRVDQMLRIADLIADEQVADEAEQALERIEGIMLLMRARRFVMLTEWTSS